MYTISKYNSGYQSISYQDVYGLNNVKVTFEHLKDV